MADVATLIIKIKSEGAQKAIQAHEKLAKSSKDVESVTKRMEGKRPFDRAASSARNLNNELDKSKSAIRAFNDGILRLGRYVASIAALYYTFKNLGRVVTGSLEAVDRYRLTIVGAAATITDLAVDQVNRQAVFNQALAYGAGMYEKLELSAAKFFASGEDLVQAWNLLIQKGVVITEDEIDNLGIIVDRIKLITQGQVGWFQIAQEIRGVMSGQARKGSELALLLKDMVPGWESIAQEMRETQSLEPLARWMQGLKFAKKEIENTLTSVRTTFMTLLSQIGRRGFGIPYDEIVKVFQDINKYLEEHRDEIGEKVYTAWIMVKDVLLTIKDILAGLGGSAVGQTFVFLLSILAQVLGQLYLWIRSNKELASLALQLWITYKAISVVIKTLVALQLAQKFSTALMGLSEMRAATYQAAAGTALLGTRLGKATANAHLFRVSIGNATTGAVAANTAFKRFVNGVRLLDVALMGLGSTLLWIGALLLILKAVQNMIDFARDPRYQDLVGSAEMGTGLELDAAMGKDIKKKRDEYLYGKTVHDPEGGVPLEYDEGAIARAARLERERKEAARKPYFDELRDQLKEYDKLTQEIGKQPPPKVKSIGGGDKDGEGGSKAAEQENRRLLSIYDTLLKEEQRLTGSSLEEIERMHEETIKKIVQGKERQITMADVLRQAEATRIAKVQELERKYDTWLAKNRGDQMVEIEDQRKNLLKDYKGIKDAEIQIAAWAERQKEKVLLERVEKEYNAQKKVLAALEAVTPGETKRLALKEKQLAIDNELAMMEIRKSRIAGEIDDKLEAQLYTYQQQTYELQKQANAIEKLKTKGFIGGIQYWARRRSGEGDTATAETMIEWLDEVEGKVSETIAAGIVGALEGDRVDFAKVGADIAQSFMEKTIDLFVNQVFTVIAKSVDSLFGSVAKSFEGAKIAAEMSTAGTTLTSSASAAGTRLETAGTTAANALRMGGEMAGEALVRNAQIAATILASQGKADFGGAKASGGFLNTIIGGLGSLFSGAGVSAGFVGFQHGGIVGGPTMALMGEDGPEAVFPLTKQGGQLGISGVAPEVNVTVVNNTGVEAEVDTKIDGRNIEVTLSKIVANDIARGGLIHRQLQRSFKVAPNVQRRG